MLGIGKLLGKDTEYVKDSFLSQNPRAGKVMSRRNPENMRYFPHNMPSSLTKKISALLKKGHVGHRN